VHSSSASLSSVQKACRILSELSNPGPHRLSNIVTNTRLNKATAIRLLETLVQDGFVTRDPVDRSYMLGNEAFVMAAVVSRRALFPECAHDSVVRLAEVSEDAACLCIPSGSDAVCIDREEGTYPLRANYLNIGRRLPLGVGSPSLALLAWLPEPEIDEMLERNRIAFTRFPRLSVERIRQDARNSRERGYAMSANIVCEGTGGIAVPILGADGRPVAALGATALVKRLVERQQMLAELLQKEASLIEASLRQRPRFQVQSRALAGEASHAGA